jgi:hypothetical protein
MSCESDIVVIFQEQAEPLVVKFEAGGIGPQGPAGPQGAQGAQGAVGPQGPQGAQGPQGEPGPAGAQGAQGPQGVAGPQGATGSQGPAGANGLSAYQVAVNGGFVGTEAQWLASLVGPQGPQGVQGPQGIQGPQGPQGATGPQGETGVQGPAGATGPQGPAGQGVPTGGTVGQVLKKVGSNDYETAWQNESGGSGAPAGSDKKVQFNNNGSFGGATNVEIEDGSLKLLPDNPTTPSNGLKIFARSLASRLLPSFIGPSGLDSSLQPSIAGNSVFCVSPANGTTAPNMFGGVLTTASTISHQQTVNAANIWQATRRTRIQTSTTAGNATGARTAYGQWYLSSTANRGGFFFRARFGMNINLNGGQKFLGLCASTGALAGDPSALTNMLGVGYDAVDPSTGNWFFMHNDGSGIATKIDLGANAARNTSDGYELIMFAKPGGGQSVYVVVINLSNNTVLLEQEFTTNIPANNTLLALKCEVRNGAVAAADNIEFSRIYIETDY